jgi:uncharacterized protein YicC (UPF0701 family)
VTSREVGILEYTEKLSEIVDNYILKGVVNPTKIAHETGLTRVEVVKYLEQWQKISNNNEWVQQRAQQSLMEFDKTYDQIIAEYWKIYEDADSTRDQNAIMKNLSDAVKTRQEVLQRAGLYDDAALGDQLAAVEQQVEEIKELLKKVAQKYPDAKVFIMEELGKIFKQPQRVDT